MLYSIIIPPLWLNIDLHKCMHHILLIYLFSLSFSAALNTHQKVFCVKIDFFHFSWEFIPGLHCPVILSHFHLGHESEASASETPPLFAPVVITYILPQSLLIYSFLFPACHKPTSKIILSTSLACRSASLHQNINSPKTGTLPVLITATFLTPRILITS